MNNSARKIKLSIALLQDLVAQIRTKEVTTPVQFDDLISDIRNHLFPTTATAETQLLVTEQAADGVAAITVADEGNPSPEIVKAGKEKKAAA